ncbi:hypothetical protein JV16_00986 [Anoxybacillus ayderensis]|uniref:DUF418 domain-containing protein n=1 Tax=Anoxybacillus ayderensis TaxID=265546 RepID=A0A0D0H179_9BACL|nr:DUF418 domain-containing protein [Anoxybacillus ayderensis]KIP21786.1 hypothetical protein JV16_00986 [Anoxybacillus ayderensis]
MRISMIDAVRGFALFGILLVNVLDFSLPTLYVDATVFAKDGLDRFLLAFVDIFAQASFYPLFSMLFGWGAWIMLDKGGEKFRITFLRRLFALLLFGMFHAFFIWHGDILIGYAIVGLFLFPFFRARAKTLRRFALSLWGGWAGVSTILMWVMWKQYGDVDFSEPTLAKQAVANYQQGTWEQIFMQRAYDWLYVNSFTQAFIFILTILPFFLFGAYIAKEKWFHDMNINRATINKWCIGSFVVGVIFKMLPCVEKNIVTTYAQDMIGGPALALFYFTAFSLMASQVVHVFAPVGKMALTNYLTQSIICTTLFYSYGFGWYGKVTPKQALAVACIVYVIQVVWSHWWLKTYRIGPMERVWRWMTYGKKKTT